MREYVDLNLFSDVIVEVYRDGRIKTKDHTKRTHKCGRREGRRGKFLSPGIDQYGYERVVLTRNGVRKSYQVHRIVAKAFIPNTENKPTVNHKNGIKADNRVENLEWATHREQKEHSIKLGLAENNIKALNEANKRRSVEVLFEGVVYPSLRQAARDTGFSRTYINKKGVRI